MINGYRQVRLMADRQEIKMLNHIIKMNGRQFRFVVVNGKT